MFALYIIGVVLLGMFAGYRYGQSDSYTQTEIGPILFLIVIAWPFFLVAGIIAAPFAGSVWLGIRSKEKRIEAEKQKEVKV